MMELHDHTNHQHQANRNIRTAFFLNLSFTLVELIGGFLTNSIAILSDALHDLGDSLSLGIAWLLQNLSQKKGDHKFSFGYRRFSLLGGLVNCVVLLIGSLFILAEAVPRILSPTSPHAEGMFTLAVLGVVVNGAAVIRLSHGKSLNERIASWHLLEDVLGWCAVLVVSVVLLFKDLPILDPILSILITLWVLYNVVGNLKKTVFVFLQGVPDNISIRDVEKKIRNVDKVKDIHHTHVWSLDGEHNVLSVHVVVDESAGREDLATIKQTINSIGTDVGIDHLTVEVEFGGHDCSTPNYTK